MLKRLEAAQLVRRSRDPRDERSVVISLTREGEAMRARAEGIPRAIAKATGLPTGELAKLRDTLRHIATGADGKRGERA
ncbi:hypothetical protein [Allorhizocola rhizosphaerae]|uniref:MarR family winged helix-turn-helix transcriptional regulator n=1 Tax=Allorhizocola rhizosphaerae TaxID=1872709 RepID=UPI001B8D16A2